jgi:DNA-binding MarR family transcriptional regulator
MYGKNGAAAARRSMRSEPLKDDSDAERPVPIGVLLHDVARLRRQMFDAQMKPAGLTRSQCWVLAYLEKNRGQNLTQSEIAEALNVGKVTLGGLVDRLETRELVRREPSADDRRVKFVRLTAKGRRAVASTDVIRPLVDDYMMRGISPRLREELAGALLRMRSNLLGVRRGAHPAKPR